MGELEQLKNNYEKIVDEYTYHFCKKYSLQFDFWVGDQKGTWACFDGYFNISFDDIKHDIDTKQSQYMKYYSYCEDQNFANCINYKTFCLAVKE